MIEGRANDLPDFMVFQTVVKYCLMIIVAPVASFFFAKNAIFDGVLQLEPVTSNVYSAVFAIVVLHVTLGLYIYKAYSDPEKASKEDKRD